MAGTYDAILDAEQGAAPTASQNPYDTFLDAEVQQNQQRVRSVFEKALTVNPDQAAESKRLATTTGLAPDLVARNLNEVKRKEQARMLDLARMAQDSPILARQMMDPSFTNQAHDHLDNLSALEQTFNVVRSVPTGAVRGVGSLLSGSGEIVNIGARATGLTAVSRVVKDLTGADLGIALDVAGSLKFAGSGWKMLADSIGVAPEDKNFATDVGEGIGQLIQQVGVQIATGGTASLVSLFSQGADAMASKTSKDNSSQALKDTAVLAGASITALTEKYGVDALLNRVPPTIKNSALRWVADKLAAGGIEATQEVTEGVLQDVVRKLITNSEAKIGEGVAYEAGVAGTSAAIVRAALGVRARGAVDQQRGVEAEQGAEQLKAQFQLASQALLRERNPDEFRTLVQSMVDNTDGAPKEIYIDAEVLNQLAPEMLAQLPQSVQDQLPDALAANDVVSIPVGDVLTVAPGTPLEAMLIENARIGGVTAMSQAEAKQAGAKAQEFLAQESQRVIAQAIDQQAMQESSDRVKQGVLDQLTTVGRFRKDVNEGYATWTAAFYTTMAGRMGVTPEQMAQQYPLKIAGQSSQGETLKTGRVGEITVEGYHYSAADRSVVSTSMYGTGLQGSNREAFQNATDKRLGKRAYFYADKGTGINPESGVGGRGHKATLTNVYDADTDPLRLKGGSQQDFESKVLDAGFSGYLDRLSGTQSGQVIMLGEQDIAVEQLGALGNTQGQRVAPAGARESKGRDVVVDALNADKSLPSGSPTLARWQELLAKNPEVLQALTDAGVFAGDQTATAYKSELIKAFQEATPAESYAQSATIRRGTETLKKYGLKPGKSYKTREVAAALEARQRAKYGTIAADDRSPEALANISKWMQAEVEFAMDNPESSGVGWYSEKFQRALDTMAQQFPELATDKVARDTMTALIAITSDGQKVVPNFAQAMDIYGNFKATGQFTTTRGTQRQASVDGNLVVVQRLHDQMGAEPMHAYLMQEKTISELKKIAKANGGDLKSDYQAHIRMPMAAVEFGPKLGAFYANLMGAHGYLTMDRWWSRSFNRYRGTLLQAPTRQGLDRFKELLGNPALSDDEVIAATVEPRNAYEAKNFKNGTELEKAANTIYKAAFENLEDSPFNATDRTFMLDAVNKAQKSLSRKGYNLSVADIQAILWYYEKRLYGELGARQTADISYEEAAQRVVAGYASGSGIESLLDDTAAAPENGGADQGRVPVGEETFNAGEVNGQLEQAGDRAGRATDAGSSPLPGAPVIAGATGPDPRLVAVAEQYARDNGIDLKRQSEYVQVDPERAARIAQAYAEMAHAPQDPAVKEAYDNLIAQTTAQYKALEAAGYKFWFIDPTNDPYKSPFDAMREMRASQTMGVFPTVAGFGSNDTNPFPGNPLEADTGIQWPYGSPDGELKPVLANDLFRAVHDAFGHGLEGAGFRAQGEENAWQAHARLFTGSAVAAITTETRGQNSWLNFGPNGESNRTAKVEDTVFADQKTGLMPSWTWTEGRAGDQSEVLNQGGPLLAPNGKPSNLTPELYTLVRTPEFKAWFGDWEAFAGMQGGVWNDTTNSVSKAVDENGEPLVVYHGTDAGGFTEFNTPGGTKRGDLGIFLSPNRAMAASYVKRGRAKDIARDQTGEDAERVSGVYPLFVNIRNPNEANFEGANWDGSRPEQFEVYDENGDTAYTEDGREFMSLDEARALADEIGGSFEDASPSGESTDSVVRDARRSNNDGAIIREVMDDGGGNSTYTGEPSDVFVAFDPTQIKSVENFGTFDAQDPNIYKQGPRGTFNPKSLELALNENADLSTFLHETGHFFLEVMADLASQPGAPADIQQDMTALLKWFGVADLATWNSYTLDQKRPYHERFAESFEQYLMEGKAPSLELQPLFRKFRAWMLNVYKSLKSFIDSRTGETNIQLSDEIRQVFDRMVASEEQIAQANEVAGLLPNEDADAEAVEKLTARSLRDLKWTVNARAKEIKKLQAQAKELRKEVEAEVTLEVNAMPEFQAKEMLDKTRKENKEQLNDTELAIIADAFQYPSVEEMLQAIDAAGKKADVIEGITDQRMLERHGDLIDQRAIEAAANEAVHNEARARSLATELKTQAEMLNPRADTGEVNAKGSKITVNALVEAAKQFAANVVAKTPLKDLKAKAWQHTAAERRAGKRWQEATAAGQTQEAVKAKQDQVLNNAAAKAAMDAQAEMRKILTFFKRVIKDNNEKVVDKGRDPDVVNAARAVLGAYGIAPKGAKNAMEYMDLVAKNDPAMHAALQPSVQGALNMAQPLDALTMDELRGLHEEIQAMWHLAKRSRQMEVDGNLLDMEDAEAELQARMQEIGVPDTMPGDFGAVTKAEERVRKLQGVRALLRRVEQWAQGMGKPFTRLVFQPVKEAADRYRADRVVYRKKYQALVDAVAPALLKGKIAAPELNYSFGEGHNGIGHAELLHAILHTGNASNKRKLLLGRGWATENADGTMDTARWDAFLTRMHDTGVLNKVHYDFAQGVWDLLEQTKPLAQKTHRDVFGRYFAEVTADSFDTPFGSYTGGYVPAQADPRIVQDADLRKLSELENENMSFSFPGTNKGFTKGRVEYNRPLMLDLRSIGQHLDKVLLFSHMEPAVRDVNKLLSRKGVSYSLGRIDPAAYAGMLTPWLNRSARQIVETPIVGDAGISRVLSAARSRAGMGLMFANVSNTLQQITGFSLAAVKVKPSSMMAATAQFIAGPKVMAQTVSQASTFMANRMENEVAAMNDAMDDILLDPTTYDKAQNWSRKHAYFMQTAMANTMEPIIWTAAYNDALARGESEKEAVRFGDSVVRTTQGSTLPEDVSRIETGPAYARIFTQFIGYFNMMANTNATALKQISQEVGLKKGAGKALGVVTLGFLIPIWVAEAIAHAMRGGPDDEDKDGYLDDWLAAVFGMGTIKGSLAMVPFVGQLANAAINRFNGNPADDKVSLSPAVSLLEAAAGVPYDVYKGITDPEKLNARNAVRDVASLVSIATGLPAVALARPLGYLAGVADNKIDPTGPVDMARGLATGTPSPASK